MMPVGDQLVWLAEEIKKAQEGIDSWKDNETKCHNPQAMFTGKDCQDMQSHYRTKKEAFELVLKTFFNDL
jgi:hypothetical protein